MERINHNGRSDDNCRWEKVGVVSDIVDDVIDIVDVGGHLVDVLHGAPPERQLDLPLQQETVPIFINGVESSLSLECEMSVFLLRVSINLEF